MAIYLMVLKYPKIKATLRSILRFRMQQDLERLKHRHERTVRMEHRPVATRLALAMDFLTLTPRGSQLRWDVAKEFHTTRTKAMEGHKQTDKINVHRKHQCSNNNLVRTRPDACHHQQLTYTRHLPSNHITSHFGLRRPRLNRLLFPQPLRTSLLTPILGHP